METTNAYIMRPEFEQPAMKVGVVNKNGFLCSVRQKGVGTPKTEVFCTPGHDDYDEVEVYDKYITVYLPFFNIKTIDKSKLTPGMTLEEAIAAGLENDLLRVGEHDGYSIWMEGEFIEGQTPQCVDLIAHSCWETGRTFYALRGRYPKHVFDAMKPHLAYHSSEEEEEGDWKAWYTFNTGKLDQALQQIGWKVRM